MSYPRPSYERDGSDTAARLLDAGELLIGDHGFDAVTLRGIMREAKTNVASLHYHFGSKEELARSIFERGVSVVHEFRAPYLSELLNRPSCTVHDVVVVWARPLLTAITERSESMLRYVRFVAAILNAGGADGAQKRGTELFRSDLRAFLELYSRARPDLPPAIRELRLRLMMQTSFRIVATWANRGLGTTVRMPAEEYAAALIDVFAGMLSGPPQSLASNA